MNRAIEQNWHGKRHGKNADFSAGIRGPSLVSNLFGPTFFSRTRPDVREIRPHKAFIARAAGKVL